MNLDELVTVAPMTAAALQRVTTPFVAFEHPLVDRVGRFERQIESMTRYMPVIVLGDTWPDSFHDPMRWARMTEIYETYTKPQERWASCVWPETALYSTNIAKLLGVNEQVRYRPQLWTFCQFFEKCNLRRSDDIDMLPEGVIYVDDRMLYPLTYPKLQLQPETCELTVVIFGSRSDVAGALLPDGAEVIEVADQPSGAAFNRAIMQAHGRFVAICQAGDTLAPTRFEQQLEDDADLSLSSIETSGKTFAWSLRGYTQRVSRFRRRPAGEDHQQHAGGEIQKRQGNRRGSGGG